MCVYLCLYLRECMYVIFVWRYKVLSAEIYRFACFRIIKNGCIFLLLVTKESLAGN